MKKSDIILAQKAIAARQVKLESQMIRQELNTMRGSTSSGFRGNTTTSKVIQLSPISPNQSKQTVTDRPSTSASRQMEWSQAKSSAFQPETHSLSQNNSMLADELSGRSVTDKTELRKVQMSVSKSLNALPTISDSDEPPPPLESDFFMPKKKLLRPDGASLHDIYLSKKGDMWGSIIKAQYVEDEENKKRKKLEKERQNEMYGIKLRQQVEEHRQMKASQGSNDDMLAKMQDMTAKRQEDMMRKRKEDAVARQKMFINYALEDIVTKRKKHQEQLKAELTASTILINNAKNDIAAAEEKKARAIEAAKTYQEQMYQENLDSIARKQKAKLSNFAEDKRIFEENERQFRREEERRKREVKERLERSAEGPAHHIVDRIVTLRKMKEDELHTMIYHADNNLNKQLKMSENAAKTRAMSNGQDLEVEWAKNTQYKATKKKEDEDRNTRILQTMAKMIADQEKEDIANREKKRQAALRYQQELDEQVTALRQRSFDSLKKTMSEQEVKLNADLIKKTAVYLN